MKITTKRMFELGYMKGGVYQSNEHDGEIFLISFFYSPCFINSTKRPEGHIPSTELPSNLKWRKIC